MLRAVWRYADRVVREQRCHGQASSSVAPGFAQARLPEARHDVGLLHRNVRARQRQVGAPTARRGTHPTVTGTIHRWWRPARPVSPGVPPMPPCNGDSQGRERMGSREESIPPSDWTESGLTPVLAESSSSRATSRPDPDPI